MTREGKGLEKGPPVGGLTGGAAILLLMLRAGSLVHNMRYNLSCMHQRFYSKVKEKQ